MIDWLTSVNGGICRQGQDGAAVVPEAVQRHRPAVVSGGADVGGSAEDGRAGEGYYSLSLLIIRFAALPASLGFHCDDFPVVLLKNLVSVLG